MSSTVVSDKAKKSSKKKQDGSQTPDPTMASYDNSIYLFTFTDTGIELAKMKSTRKLNIPFSAILTAEKTGKAEKEIILYYMNFVPNKAHKTTLGKATMSLHCSSDSVQRYCDYVISKTYNVPMGETPKKKKIAILVNPYGGTGKALKIYESIRLVLEKGFVDVNLVVTTHARHAEEYCQKTDISEFRDGVVTISGDGMLNEAVNGLLHRKDWRDVARQVPIGVIPGGSGNGLAKSLNVINPVHAAYIIARGQTRPIDVYSALLNGTKRFGFLNVEWGVLSAIDFESESIRWMGGSRFTVWALKKVLDFDMYPATIYYKVSTDTAYAKYDQDIDGTDQSMKSIDEFEFTIPGEEELYLTGPKLQHFPIQSHDGWKKDSGKYSFFMTGNVTHISYDTCASPLAHMSDGCLDMVVCKKASRRALTSLFLGLEDGNHIKSADVKNIKVQAYVVHIKSKKADDRMIGIDGEQEFTDLLAVELHANLMNIFCNSDEMKQALVKLIGKEQIEILHDNYGEEPKKKRRRRKVTTEEEDNESSDGPSDEDMRVQLLTSTIKHHVPTTQDIENSDDAMMVHLLTATQPKYTEVQPEPQPGDDMTVHLLTATNTQQFRTQKTQEEAQEEHVEDDQAEHQEEAQEEHVEDDQAEYQEEAQEEDHVEEGGQMGYICQVKAIHDYEGEQEGDLAFAKGDMINVLTQDESGWWRGELNGKIGDFPKNFVQE